MIDAPVVSALASSAAIDEEGVAGAEAFGRCVVAVPALFSMAGPLRKAIDGLLAGHPRRDDARRVVDEFVTAALIELRCSCCRHGQVTLAVDRDERRIRVEVSYFMVLSHPPVWRLDWHEDPVETFGLGLALIEAFSDRWGHMVRQVGEPYYADKHQTWYAEFDDVPAAAPALEAAALGAGAG